ncbi:MAG: lycopene cyclase family protein [Flavobacteriaceae bacterium]
MQEHDYIITGTGASGLMLAYRMAKDPFFDHKSILIIDKEKKYSNDRTWCFWENGVGEWDDIIHKSWKKIAFKSKSFKNEFTLKSYSYKMIRSASFYKKMWDFIATKNNITFVEDTVINISHKKHGASVLTLKTEYHTLKLINSIAIDKDYKQQVKFPLLQQHFLGWFIETKEDTFNDSVATFMDFTVNQKRNTRFMYVLPQTSKIALFEFTLFSKKLLPKEEYEREIRKYLEQRSITDYKIIEKEYGIIPMTSYRFWRQNSNNVLFIGTIGGWTKASTGFTFMNTTKKTKKVIDFIKTGKSFRSFRKPTRFWYYDLFLIDILSRHNHIGASIFSKLFKRNSIQSIFKFLDEESNFIQDLKIMLTMPFYRFTWAFIRRLFNF